MNSSKTNPTSPIVPSENSHYWYWCVAFNWNACYIRAYLDSVKQNTQIYLCYYCCYTYLFKTLNYTYNDTSIQRVHMRTRTYTYENKNVYIWEQERLHMRTSTSTYENKNVYIWEQERLHIRTNTSTY